MSESTVTEVCHRMLDGAWSVRKLAAVLGVSFTTVSRWRNGTHTPPGGWKDAIVGAELCTPKSERGRFKASYFTRPVSNQRQRILSQRMARRQHQRKVQQDKRMAAQAQG